MFKSLLWSDGTGSLEKLYPDVVFFVYTEFICCSFDYITHPYCK